jgi:hypothetical protein
MDQVERDGGGEEPIPSSAAGSGSPSRRCRRPCSTTSSGPSLLTAMRIEDGEGGWASTPRSRVNSCEDRVVLVAVTSSTRTRRLVRWSVRATGSVRRHWWDRSPVSASATAGSRTVASTRTWLPRSVMRSARNTTAPSLTQGARSSAAISISRARTRRTRSSGLVNDPGGVEHAHLVDEVAGVALPVGALVPDPDRDPLVEPHRLSVLLVGGRAARRGDRAVAVGDDAQVGVATGDARQVRLLCALVTAAEVLKQHRRRPELGDHRRQQPALGGQFGHHAGDEHRLGLRPGPQLLVGEPAGRRHPVDDQDRLRPRGVHEQALADLDRSSTEPTGPVVASRQRPDSGCDVPTGYGTGVP